MTENREPFRLSVENFIFDKENQNHHDSAPCKSTWGFSLNWIDDMGWMNIEQSSINWKIKWFCEFIFLVSGFPRFDLGIDSEFTSK